MVTVLTDEKAESSVEYMYSDGFALGSIRVSTPYLAQAAEVFRKYLFQSFRSYLLK